MHPDSSGPPPRPDDAALAGYTLLDYNESAAPPPEVVIDGARRALARLHRYPDANASRLSTLLADRLQVEPSQVVVGCGSLSLLHAAFAHVASAGGRVAYTVPAFVEYPRIAAATSLTAQEISTDPPSLQTNCQSLEGALVLCNPDNPTGRWLSDDALGEVASWLPAEALLIIDEAYIEFATSQLWPEAGLALVRSRANTIVLRTFSKLFGLAALRVGYAITGTAMADRLREVHLSFAANSVGLAAAEACLGSAAEEIYQERLAAAPAHQAAFAQGLRAVFPSIRETRANFVLAETKESAATVAQRLRDDSVFVAYAGPTTLRITVPDPADTDRVVESLRLACARTKSR